MLKKTMLILLLCSIAYAQSDFPRYGLDFGLNMSYKNGIKASNNVSNNLIESNSNFPGVYFRLNYYANINWNLILSLSVLSTKINNEVSWNKISSDALVIIPIDVNLNYNFIINKDFENIIKPYLTAGIGIVLGISSSTGLLFNNNNSEQALGANIGGGLNFYFNDWLKLNMEAKYRLTTNFINLTSENKNFSGPEINLGIGFIF